MKWIVQIIIEESVRKAVTSRGLIRYINMRCDLLFGDGCALGTAR